MEKEERFKQAEFAAIIGILGNIVLAAVKGAAGIMGNSKALLADAVHSASDVAGSLAVWVGLRAAKRPPDEDHPYGHGKAESIAAIIVAVLLFIVGAEMGRSSLQAFFQPLHPPKWLAIYVVVLSIVVKEAMFRYKYRLGKKLNSQAIIVNAYEHRSDVFSSIAALIGIGAAMAGHSLGINKLVYADPIAGLFVSFLVLKMAWELGKQSIHTTLDHVLHEEDTVHLRQAVLQFPEVKQIHELHAREHGHYVIIDLKIAVDPLLTVEEGHRIGKAVKERLLRMPNIENVMVHINPYHPEK
ncbi:cation diffusion facilitator transporter family protein [Anoxybacillus sp. B7M1]|uniref:Cation diffusion facilitator family transporter n=1 Tax=Anoxybacteroides rupiense TaxID=311460 RepID=A0ABD5IU99_9BACL|nr:MULTISPECIES: cation diffusion facilitator family transporter [Anoxybacillus]ANB58223.1 cation diffusion facilitator transporter family protein [Anoxybacillus sp. B2M1]ANB65455.1 cation diffusion facilitator transporter family protein [Anoxybacillus sp. B7M1]MBB3907259.1 cation diffusion facilitator family transporter [Anoxybacillus rupiensis]MED5050971.1 cation diffusion facilitator family transporter [Anoxybacillus rupiensis]